MTADRHFAMTSINLCFDVPTHRYIVSACNGNTGIFWRSFSENNGYDARAYAEVKARMYGIPFVDETVEVVEP